MKYIAGIVAVLVMVGAAMVNAEDVKSVELKGSVVVAKDDEGQITSASLKTGEGEEVQMLGIKLDKNGKALVLAAGDNVVKVTGTVVEAEGEATITVTKFELVKEEPAL